MRYFPTSRFDVFNDLFDDVFTSRNEMMKTDIKELDGKYELDIELPGFDKKDVNIELYDGYLTISASKNEENEEKDNKGNIIRQERHYGSCSRSYFVGNNITEKEVMANMENGVLKISVPSAESKKLETKKTIQIA